MDGQRALPARVEPAISYGHELLTSPEQLCCLRRLTAASAETEPSQLIIRDGHAFPFLESCTITEGTLLRMHSLEDARRFSWNATTSSPELLLLLIIFANSQHIGFLGLATAFSTGNSIDVLDIPVKRSRLQ